MTASEKAYQLYNRFLFVPFKNERFNAKDIEAKECALICVDEIIKAVMDVCDDPIRINHLQEVKQEIINL